jgi:tetrahydromethanopterin S-methyltransferase subunit B
MTPGEQKILESVNEIKIHLAKYETTQEFHSKAIDKLIPMVQAHENHKNKQIGAIATIGSIFGLIFGIIGHLITGLINHNK